MATPLWIPAVILVIARHCHRSAWPARARHRAHGDWTARGARRRQPPMPLGANDSCTSSPGAMTTVETFRCQLRETLSTLETGLVRTRNIEFNTVLPEECAPYASCHFDNNTAFSFQFGTSHVSNFDYFRSRLSVQAALADTAWGVTW
jgi:hypothetical protein